MLDGSCYKGVFDQNEISGHGKQYYAWSNNTYEGQFYLGERHGRGKMIFCTGDVYNGDWSANRIEGKLAAWCFDPPCGLGEGEFRYRDGSCYTGSFLNNKRHGCGVWRTE